MNRFAELAAILMLVVLSLLSFDAVQAAPAPTRPALHQADFRITGASCVVCLRRIGKTLHAAKGVLKADVSIYRPYWAIVIYDANQTKMTTVLQSIASEKVKIEDMEDKAIAGLPLLVMPRHVVSPAGPMPTGH